MMLYMNELPKSSEEEYMQEVEGNTKEEKQFALFDFPKNEFSELQEQLVRHRSIIPGGIALEMMDQERAVAFVEGFETSEEKNIVAESFKTIIEFIHTANQTKFRMVIGNRITDEPIAFVNRAGTVENNKRALDNMRSLFMTKNDIRERVKYCLDPISNADIRAMIEDISDDCEESCKKMLKSSLEDASRSTKSLQMMLDLEDSIFSTIFWSEFDLKADEKFPEHPARFLSAVYHLLLQKVLAGIIKNNARTRVFEKAVSKKDSDKNEFFEVSVLRSLDKIFQEITAITLSGDDPTHETQYMYLLLGHEFCAYIAALGLHAEGKRFLEKYLEYNAGKQEITETDMKFSMQYLERKVMDEPILWEKLTSKYTPQTSRIILPRRFR